MPITDRATAQAIMAAITASGAKVPKVVTDTYQRTVRLSDTARNMGAPPDALAAAVAAAIEDDRDPAADPEVQRLLTLAQIANQGIVQAVDAIAYDRLTAVCLQHVDAIIEAWQVPFIKAASTLAEARERMGPVRLEDTDDIMRRGDDIAAVWAEATAAVKMVDTIANGWTALAEFVRTVPNDRRYSLLRLAAVDYPTWRDQGLQGKRLAAWQIVLAGLELSLPTAAEYRGRVRAIEEGERRDAARREQEQRTGRRVTA